MEEINQLIREETDPRNKEILKELKKLCHFSDGHMRKPYQSWRTKYRSLQKTHQWRKARMLLKEYFTKDGILECPKCPNKIYDRFTLHHDMYGKPYNYFNPLYVQLIHGFCHKSIHK